VIRVPNDEAPRASLSGAGGYVFATVIALLALIVAFAATRYLSVANLSLILLVAVLIVAVRTRMAVSIYTAIVCFVGYNFFFTRPYYTLAIARADDLVTVLLFLVVALICSRMATRLAGQVESLRLAQQRAATLLQLGKQLAGSADARAVRLTAATTMAQALRAQVVMLERDHQRTLHPVLSVPPDLAPSATDIAAASWNTRATEGDLRFLADASGYWIVPMDLPSHDHGAVALLLDSDDRAHPHQGRYELALAMCQDIALALERVRLADALEQARVQAETEHLRNALLSSVSHDLRSPLASIIGSASTLVSYQDQLPAKERKELAEGIVHEGERLDRYIQNLLDMTRLGHGTLPLKRDWVDAGEVVLTALARLQKFFPAQFVTTALPNDTLLLHVHPALIEQALFNVLENAAHFSPADQAVHVAVGIDDDQLLIEVSDRGPGIPAEERARVFDMFYSVSRGDRGNHGTGLGLAICRGMIGAHGGNVEALSRDGGGTTIRIVLPLSVPSETLV
jgi:two-component system sensor histidine kinase KdpD